ncbi:MOSC domain-containing protein [Actinomadura sp. DLS-62]|uniref:MOSC domain-containing protein n=1 Tax=Actinomadura monticuli TaxID=3097367 RepID=A0ABV4QKM1_9ACTN
MSCPRIPCGTFQGWLDEAGWIKRFTRAARPGAYLRVVEPGEIRAGDAVDVVHRPGHDVTAALCFRALTAEPGLLPRLIPVEALPDTSGTWRANAPERANDRLRWRSFSERQAIGPAIALRARAYRYFGRIGRCGTGRGKVARYCWNIGNPRLLDGALCQPRHGLCP